MAEPASGITTRTFKSGSIIYFEGDRSDNIFILKAGRVILTSIRLDTQEEMKENVRIGEFFGVKSALGKYPREETAQAVGETTILVLRPADFERITLKNVALVRKMLRIFSNQLRRIHSMVRNEMGQSSKIDPASELFNIGEYYYKTGIYQQAIYAYKKSLEHYPDMPFAGKAMQRIKDIETGNVKPSSAPKQETPQSSSSDFSGDDDFFDMGDTEAAPSSGDGDGFDSFGFDSDDDDSFAQSELSSDLDDFLSEDDGLSDFDDFSMDEPEGTSLEDKLADADSLFQSGQFADAAAAYQDLINSGELENDQAAEAYVALGRCNVKQNKTKDAGNCFNTVLKNYPSSPAMRSAYFEVGNMFVRAGQKEKAAPYFKKVMSMTPKDGLTNDAAAALKQIQG